MTTSGIFQGIARGRFALLAVAVVLGACGGEDDEAAGGLDNQDRPPVLDGDPPTEVVVDSTFSFKPTASDPDGDPLLFGADGLPPFLELDSLTGELTGAPGPDDVGTYRGIVVWVTDGEHDTLLPPFDLVVAPIEPSDNTPPTIDGSPDTQVVADEAYRFAPQAEDADGDTLTFTIRNRPAWAVFAADTGVLEGTPAAASAGSYEDIVIAVSDGESTTSLPPFSIAVTLPGVNTGPTISGDPATSVAVGTTYSFTPTASDVDGDMLTFSVDNAPVWASFDPVSGELSGMSGAGHVGTYEGIAISVSDGVETAELPAFSVTVTEPTTNTPPTITGSPPSSVLQGEAYEFTPSADDVDGDSLTFGIANRPSWATFDTDTGRLHGVPDAGDVGRYRFIRISVSDGEATAVLPGFSVTVEGQNSAPTISGSPATSVSQGEAYSFQPTAQDADGDALTFAISGRPDWAAFDTATGRLSGTPGASDVGSHDGIAISVTDGSASAQLAQFSITVTAVQSNGTPTISGTPAAAVTAGTQYSFTPAASDPDDDPLTFSIQNRPSWASFNSSTGRLAGTPDADDVGSHGGISISVSDGSATAQLATFSIMVNAPPTSNAAPTISGSPPASVTAGTEYSFTPVADDDDGDTLTFSIQNRPSWATFSTSTGRLRGTPSSAGTFGNIRISVSDGTASAQLAAFTITVIEDVPENRAPTISGSPATSVVQDTAYSFQPSASDPDGDVLTFSIQNRPSWASFNTSNGRLSGTPDGGDVGSYTNIRISVTDGEETTALAAFSIDVEAIAMGSATLSWTAPDQKTDGTPLTNLAGFKVYWGRQSGSYTNEATIDNPGVTTYVVENLTAGTWYFVTTAFDSNGLESEQSNVASKTIQ